MKHKFRIYDKKRKKWLHDTEHAISLFGEVIILGEILNRGNGEYVKLEDLNDLEAMQYTGQKDKSRKEIYAEDIIKNDEFIERIYWDDKRCNFHRVNQYGGGGILTKYIAERSEIIGNTVDSPDFYKKENKK